MTRPTLTVFYLSKVQCLKVSQQQHGIVYSPNVFITRV